VARKPEEDLTQSVMQVLKKGFNEPFRRGGRRKQWTQTILEDLREHTVRGISDWERIMRKAKERDKWRNRINKT
jgi:hypothetical protein